MGSVVAGLLAGVGGAGGRGGGVVGGHDEAAGVGAVAQGDGVAGSGGVPAPAGGLGVGGDVVGRGEGAAVVVAGLDEDAAALGGSRLAAHDLRLAHGAAVGAGEQDDVAGGGVDDGGGVAAGVAVSGGDDQQRAPGAAPVGGAPQDDVDGAGVARVAASALGEGQQGAGAGRDQCGDAVGGVAGAAGGVGDGGGAVAVPRRCGGGGAGGCGEDAEGGEEAGGRGGPRRAGRGGHGTPWTALSDRTWDLWQKARRAGPARQPERGQAALTERRRTCGCTGPTTAPGAARTEPAAPGPERAGVTGGRTRRGAIRRAEQTRRPRAGGRGEPGPSARESRADAACGAIRRAETVRGGGPGGGRGEVRRGCGPRPGGG